MRIRAKIVLALSLAVSIAAALAVLAAIHGKIAADWLVVKAVNRTHVVIEDGGVKIVVNSTFTRMWHRAFIDEHRAEMLRELPSYGCMWVDVRTGTVYVMLTNVSDEPKVREILKGFKVVIVKAKYTYRQLVNWSDVIESELSRNLTLCRAKVYMCGIDKVPVKGNIGITLCTGNSTVGSEQRRCIADEFRRLVESRLGVPGDAINVEVIKEVELLDKTDVFNPLIAGAKIAIYDGYYLHYCTLGAPALLNGVEKGFVTAGHCSRYNGTSIVLVNTLVYQPDVPYYVGTVTKNQPGPRYSDACWVKVMEMDVSHIMYPNDVFFINDDKPSDAWAGLIMMIDGYITREWAEIVAVCRDVPYNPVYGELYCQIIGKLEEYSPKPVHGDSGAPAAYDICDVFDGTVYCTWALSGIFWGIDELGNVYVSPMWGVEMDLSADLQTPR